MFVISLKMTCVGGEKSNMLDSIMYKIKSSMFIRFKFENGFVQD